MVLTEEDQLKQTLKEQLSSVVDGMHALIVEKELPFKVKPIIIFACAVDGVEGYQTVLASVLSRDSVITILTEILEEVEENEGSPLGSKS